MVLMPDTAPVQRQKAIRDLGVQVMTMPSAKLMEGVKKVHDALNRP